LAKTLPAPIHSRFLVQPEELLEDCTMANEGYHEPASELTDEARDMQRRTIVALMGASGAAPQTSMATAVEPAPLRFKRIRIPALAFSGTLHGMMVPSIAVVPRQSRAVWQSAAA
jgi:hypothetical protein